MTPTTTQTDNLQNDEKKKAYPIPAEAEKVEAEIKKKKKELAAIKTQSVEELEAKEQMIA